MKVYPTTRKEKIRLAVLLAIMFSLLPFGISSTRSLLDDSGRYAITFSFGRGYGHVFYSRDFNKLHPVLQEVVRVHERVHLERGTWQFWKQDELECEAYEAEIEYMDRVKAELLAKFEETNDAQCFNLYRLLSNFQREARYAKSGYEK